MMNDELIRIWRSSSKEEQIKFDKSRLMINLKSSLDRFDRYFKYAMLVEQVVVWTVIPVFLFYIYFVPFLWSKVASVLIAFWAIGYMQRLRKMKRIKVNGINVDYIAYLTETKVYLKVLKRMAEAAIIKDFFFLGSGLLLFLLGPILAGVLVGGKMIVILVLSLSFLLACYFFTKWMTKRLYYDRLEKLDELIATMEE